MVPSRNLGDPIGVIVIEFMFEGLSALKGDDGDKMGDLVLAVIPGDPGGLLGAVRGLTSVSDPPNKGWCSCI